MKQLDSIKVSGEVDRIPGGIIGIKVLKLKLNIRLQKILDFFKKNKFKNYEKN